MAFQRRGNSSETSATPSASTTGGSSSIQISVHHTEKTNPTTTAVSIKHELEAGAVAGIAVGALLAGVLIASLAFCFLLRRKKKKQAAAAAYRPRRLSRNERTEKSDKGSHNIAHTPASSIDEMIPQPVADERIEEDLSKIRDNIKNHVRIYYHSDAILVNEIDEGALQDVADVMGTSTSVLAHSLVSPSARNDAIRLVVGCIMLSRCGEEHDQSFLPYHLAGLATLIAGKSDCRYFPSIRRIFELKRSIVQSAMYSKWKAITGALLQQHVGKQPQDVTKHVTDAISKIDAILAPFIVESADHGKRHRNLDMILKRSAKLAFLLFSQPASFRFDFSGRENTLVVFPALEQTVDDHGQALNRPRILVEKEVASV